LTVTETRLPGVLILQPKRFDDHRGYFSEVYNKRAMAEFGIEDEFVQDNQSLSLAPKTVRGLHFQVSPYPVAKLVRVVTGAIFDVVVDVRHGSATFGEHVAVELSADGGEQLYVPVGFAHGFCTLVGHTTVAYKVTDYWYPEVDKGILWNDPDLGIDWPLEADEAVVSDKDWTLPRLRRLAPFFDSQTVA
jgi:dTDP-4-dehydrorhamnose 3,5-epimerase